MLKQLFLTLGLFAASLILTMFIGLEPGLTFSFQINASRPLENNAFVDNHIIAQKSYNLCEQKVDHVNFRQSTNVKAAQLNLLAAEIKKYPLLGRGLGSYLENCIRSYSTPWAYEILILSIIMQIGILAFICFVCFFAYLTYSNIRLFLENQNTLYVFGIQIFLIMILINLTNAYLLKFDFMWLLFLSYFLLIATKLKRQSSF